MTAQNEPYNQEKNRETENIKKKYLNNNEGLKTHQLLKILFFCGFKTWNGFLIARHLSTYVKQYF